MSYGSTRYKGNPYSTLSELKKWQSKLDAIKHGFVASHFSPEEIRGMISNIREASAKLAEVGSVESVSLIRELTSKLEEMTQTVLAKSAWDRRFANSENK